MAPNRVRRDNAGLLPPVPLMAAKLVSAWPTDGGYVVEPKFDGWRACVFRLPAGVYVQSRPGRDLSRYFPEVVTAAERLPVGTVIDGELVIWNGDRTDFALLQKRIASPADPSPANLVCFDLLQHPTQGLVMEQPLSARRELLTDLLVDASPQLTLCPQGTTFEQADVWMRDWTSAGIEGVVIKKAHGRYRPGKRDWLKRRTRTTIDLVVGGVVGDIDQPRALLLGEYTGHGRFAYRGRTLPLTPAQSRELGALTASVNRGALVRAWPNPLPGRWANMSTNQPLPYIALEPQVVVEVDADTAFEHGRFRHGLRLVRVRADLLPNDLTRFKTDTS